MEDACSWQLGKYLQSLQCYNLDYLVSGIASPTSSQEAYVTIKYRLENNGSEPRLNDIGVRRDVLNKAEYKCSEPRLNDIGVRLAGFNLSCFKGSEPSLNDMGVRLCILVVSTCLCSEPRLNDIGIRCKAGMVNTL